MTKLNSKSSTEESNDDNNESINGSKVIGSVNDEKPVEIELSLKENKKQDKSEEPGEQINLFEWKNIFSYL